MTDPDGRTMCACVSLSLSLSLVPMKSGVSPENAAYINKRIPSQLANKMGSVFAQP